jgi:hypothetical protein
LNEEKPAVSRLLKIFYSPRAFDVVFALAVVMGLAIFAFGSNHVARPIDPSVGKLAKGATLVALMLASGVLACNANRLDQLCADDFVFQMLGKSAMIGMFTVVFGASIWQLLFLRSMGELPGVTIMGMVLFGWGFGYFYTRIRGTRP